MRFYKESYHQSC